MPIDVDAIITRVIGSGDDRAQHRLEFILARLEAAQRWAEHRAIFLGPEDLFQPHRYAVEPISRIQAKAFITGHHYLGTFATSLVPVGLWESRAPYPPELVGVAVFGIPAREGIAKYTVGTFDNAMGVELNRFVLRHEVPYHAETWFLKRAFRWVTRERPEVRVVLSFSDPVPRTTLSGQVVMPGHIGTIYQAFNGIYVGRTRRDYEWQDLQGRTIGGRLLSKITRGQIGEVYAAERLIAAGAPQRRWNEDPAAWTERALQQGPFRRVAHPGKHIYLWAIGRRKHEALRTLPPTTVPVELTRLIAHLSTLEEDERVADQKGDRKTWRDVRRDQRKTKTRIKKLEKHLEIMERYPGDPLIKAAARRQRAERYGR
jgi:hypothetical protein